MVSALVVIASASCVIAVALSLIAGVLFGRR